MKYDIFFLRGQHVLLIVLLSAASLASCDTVFEEPVDYGSIEDIRFSEHVQPLLEEKFGDVEAPGLELDSWAQLIEGADFGEVVIPFDAENSLLLEWATKLPDERLAALGGEPLTPEQVAVLRRWINEGARNDAGQVPYADADHLLYVCNQADGIISVIDTDANLVIRSVKLADYGYTGTPKPHHVAVDPDGAHFYVSLIGADEVAKFSRAKVLAGDDALEGAAPFEAPGMMVRHPTADRLYAGHTLSIPSVPPTVAAIRTSDMTTLERVNVPFERPHPMTVHPGGRYAYSASLTQNRLAAIDTDGENEVTLSAFNQPAQRHVQFAVAPDGQAMYLTSQTTGQVLVFDVQDPARPALAETIDVNPGAWHPVFTPDGRRVYFGNKAANTVTAIDAASRSVAAVIEGDGLAQPHGSAVSHDGRYVYISNNNQNGTYTPRYEIGDDSDIGTVVVIDTATNEIVKVLEIEKNPVGMNTRRR